MNPQGLLHMDLNHTRLPVPPPEHMSFEYSSIVNSAYTISQLFDFATPKIIFFEFFLIFFTKKPFLKSKTHLIKVIYHIILQTLNQISCKFFI